MRLSRYCLGFSVDGADSVRGLHGDKMGIGILILRQLPQTALPISRLPRLAGVQLECHGRTCSLIAATLPDPHYAKGPDPRFAIPQLAPSRATASIPATASRATAHEVGRSFRSCFFRPGMGISLCPRFGFYLRSCERGRGSCFPGAEKVAEQIRIDRKTVTVYRRCSSTFRRSDASQD